MPKVQECYTEGTELMLAVIIILLLIADIGIACLMLMLAAVVGKMDKTS